MRMRTLGPAFPILGLSFFLAACDTTMEPSPKPTVEAFLNVPFSLSVGQAAVLAEEHLSVTFMGVLADSRCPADLICMWAGDATMSVRARQEGKAAGTLSLTLSPQGVVYEGFGIHPQQLTPHPLSDSTTRPEDYRVSLLVDRP